MDQWNGPTYYGRPQLKPAPFKKSLVGGYVFLAGVSGGAQLLATLLDLTRGDAVRGVVRRGRMLALLAPVIGSPLLIADLHTPKRFYNMLRVFKHTSPMSIGTWILTAFSLFSGATAAAQVLMDRVGGFGRIAKLAQVPAAAAGAGLGTYTAGLFSATSTPFWAAATRALAVRFAASSIASAAAALSLCADRRDVRQDLDMVCAGALAVELAATLAAEEVNRRTGVDRAQDGVDGAMDRIGAVGIGTLLPLGLLSVALLTGSRSRTLSGSAACAVLGGSLMMRIAMIGSGEASAKRPDISLWYTQAR
ncbi:NrfD/PsrC family molybdoenzyme membrane anchor subunit [Rhodopila sp.]|uniref:NrfD/PsrC family molybdoenzyme membrane anchor subunit n=1 Tax=Rhodopila sp. TaxID=2480087 RepID=UPI003D0CED27